MKKHIIYPKGIYIVTFLDVINKHTKGVQILCNEYLFVILCKRTFSILNNIKNNISTPKMSI